MSEPDVVDDVGGVEAESVLSDMLARAERRRARKVMLQAPGLGFELVCDVPTSQEAIDRLRSVAIKRHGKKAFALPFFRALIAEQTRRILTERGPLLVEGEEVAFTDRELQSMMGVASASEAVARMLGGDGEVSQIAVKLLGEGGFTEDSEAVEADPI